jgi:hypothetical protein
MPASAAFPAGAGSNHRGSPRAFLAWPLAWPSPSGPLGSPSSQRRWGPRRLVFELGQRGHPDLSRSTVYRMLVWHRLLEPVPHPRRGDQYRRWERSAAMELWQLDVTASLFLADGRECKIITGIDDHSRFCAIATRDRYGCGAAEVQVRDCCPDLGFFSLERVTGIEPALSAWEADVLPLNYTRADLQ